MAHKEQFTHKLELYLVEINGDTLMNTLDLSILVQSLNTQTPMQHTVVLPEVSCMLLEEGHQGSMYRFASGCNM